MTAATSRSSKRNFARRGESRRAPDSIALNETQFYMSMAVMPVTTIIIVLIGVLLNNANMNARFGDLNARFGDMNGRFGDMSPASPGT
jgi:hypothetical protein